MKVQTMLGVIGFFGILAGCGTSEGPSLLKESNSKSPVGFSMSFARTDYRYDEYGAQFRIKCSDNSREVLSITPGSTVSISCPDSAKIQFSYIVGTVTGEFTDHYYHYIRMQGGSNIAGWHGEFFQDVTPAVLEFDSTYDGGVVEFQIDWED